MKSMMMWGGLVLTVMAGCSNIQDAIDKADEVDAVDSYANLQEDYASTASDLAALGPTLDADLPLNGTATYDGQAQITLATPTRESDLVGHSTITADFAAGDLTGKMSGFYGSIDGGTIGSMNGEIMVSYGDIDSTRADEIYIEVDGTLSDSDDVLVVDAALAGTFMGDPATLDAAPEGMILGSTGASEFELNGPDVNGTMTIVGTTND